MLQVLGKKILSYLIVAVVCFLAGGFLANSYLKKSQPKTSDKTQIVEIQKDTVKKTNQDLKITKTERKPDGTVTTEVIESKTKTDEHSAEKTKEIIKEKLVFSPKKEYSLGFGASVDFSHGFKDLTPNYHLGVGKRLFADLWADAQYGFRPDFTKNEIQFMLRWEF